MSLKPKSTYHKSKKFCSVFDNISKIFYVPGKDPVVIFHTHNLPDETHARTHNQPGDSRAIIPTLEEMTFLRKMTLIQL